MNKYPIERQLKLICESIYNEKLCIILGFKVKEFNLTLRYTFEENNQRIYKGRIVKLYRCN